MSYATIKILTLLFCLLHIDLGAQIKFTSFNKDNGLSSTNIITTKVDHRGIIWVGTTNGIVAFTGKEWFPVKSIVDREGRNINVGRVYRIFQAMSGDIWFLSEKGIFVYNEEYWTYFNDNENEGSIVSDIFEDRRGWIWVMFEKRNSMKDVANLGFSIVEGNIQMYFNNQWYKYPRFIGGSAAITIGDPVEYFTSYMQDEAGNIWVTNLDGLYKFDGGSWAEYDDDELSSDKCYSVLESSTNEIWVATQHGVAKKNKDNWIKFEKAKGIKDNTAYNLFEDKNNNIWVITRKDSRFKSLCVFNNGSWKQFDKNDIEMNGEVSQLVHYDSSLIAFSRKGLSMFDGGNWTNLFVRYKIDDDNFSNLTIARNKTLWFVSRSGLYSFNNEGLLLVFSPEKTWKVNTLFESSNGNIWVGTEKKGVFVIRGNDTKNMTTDNGLTDNYVKQVFEDKQGRVWVVTRNGINRYN